MGLNIGGIYVESNKKEHTQKSVADFIREYWLKLGAKESKADPKIFEPLKLEKTGFLGFAIGPKAQDKAGNLWIGIYDSERYRADSKLASKLSSHFGVDVWFYYITDSANEAYAKKFGEKKQVIRNYQKALDKAESFPYPFLYFNQLKDFSKDQLKDFTFLSFESVPFRPNEEYSGPSPERLKTNNLIIKAREYIVSKNVEELITLSENQEVYLEAIYPIIENSDLSSTDEVDFIYKLGQITIKKKKSFCSVAEAALRMNDEKMFEEAMNLVPQYSLYNLETRGREISNNGEPYFGFRLFEEQCFRTNYQEPRLLNNAVHYFQGTVEHPGISPERLQKLLDEAYDAGKVNPAIFHNLAGVYVRLKNYNKALDCVADAVKYGYYALNLMETDTDLDPIKSDPRFIEAFQKREALNSFEHLKMSRVHTGKEVSWITPTVGLHLYFKNDQACKGASYLVEELYKEFPEMFTYYLKPNYIELFRTRKGKVEKDINLLRKGGLEYGYNIYYNSLPNGGASDLRFYLELDSERNGEITVHLPIHLAEKPQELYDRFVRYASLLPFVSGNAGYSFSVYYEHNGSPSSGDIQYLFKSYLGFTTSQATMHLIPNTDTILPNWLTFLSPSKTKEINLKDLPANCIKLLKNKGIVIQAAKKPIVGLVTNPNDLDLLPQVIKVMQPFLTKSDSNDFFINSEVKRLKEIMKLK